MRGVFHIDGDAYFKRLASVLPQAEHSLWIVGWDFDSRISVDSHNLGKRLSDLAKARPNLSIYILIWDASTLFDWEREPFPRLRALSLPENIFFRLDAETPAGGSHHQKFVVIDDRVAFCGGIDLTRGRDDSPKHDTQDRRPIHDIQMEVEGPVAQILGDIARDRWKSATGEIIDPPPKPTQENMKTAASPADFVNAPISVARTQPAFAKRKEIREIEQLHLDLIGTAERHIYIENQYLTSNVVTKALKKSLRKRKGPEIVIVLPEKMHTGAENFVMGNLQKEAIQNLRRSDKRKRLGIFYPVLPLNSSMVMHSKLMIIDDIYARVGSANLSNRSMGLDTECDLVLDGSKSSDHEAAIRRLKARLLSEHLGTSKEEILDAMNQNPSIRNIITQHASKARYLESFPSKKATANEEVLNFVKSLADRDHAPELPDIIHAGHEKKGFRVIGTWTFRIFLWVVFLLFLGFLIIFLSQ